MTVVTLGETMIRLSPPRGDLLVDAQRLDLLIGGAEANVAVALAALGVAARWLGALPRNPLGERVASSLAAAGVDVSRVVWRDEGRVGLYFVEDGVSPRPARVLYDRAGSAMTTMTADDLPDDALEGASHAVVSGITAALRPDGAALAQAFLARAAGAGCRRIVDVNHRARLWDAAEAAVVLADLVREAEVVFCSVSDARSVFGLDTTVAELAGVLQREIATGAELVIVTDGARGATAWHAQAGAFAAGSHQVESIDPIGAGDALVAGVVWGELAGYPPAEALRAGIALAALACTVRGDHARFDETAVRAVLDGVGVKALR